MTSGLDVAAAAEAVLGGQNTPLPAETLLLPYEIAVGSQWGLLALFTITEVFVFKQMWILMRPAKTGGTGNGSVSFSGERTRSIFLTSMAVAATVRWLTVGWRLLYNDFEVVADHNDFEAWLNALIEGVPAILFLTTFSIVILFFAQIYYTANWIELPYLHPIFAFMNASVYVVLIMVAFLTHLLKAFSELRIYWSLIEGTLYTLTAIAFGFYGLKVAFQFSGDAISREQQARKAAVVRRVLGLSIFCPLMFEVRGVYDLSVGFGLMPKGALIGHQQPITWEYLVILVSEWIPMTFALFTFWPPAREQPKAYGTHPAQQMRGLTSPLLPAPEQPFGGAAANDFMRNFTPNKVYPLGVAAVVVPK